MENFTFSLIRGLVNTNQSVTKLEHIVAKGDDDKLRVLRPVLDIVRNDGDIAKIQSSINLVHEVEWRWLCATSLSGFTHKARCMLRTLNTCSAKTSAKELSV